jgi:hypothetical protein
MKPKNIRQGLKRFSEETFLRAQQDCLFKPIFICFPYKNGRFADLPSKIGIVKTFLYKNEYLLAVHSKRPRFECYAVLVSWMVKCPTKISLFLNF